MAFNYLETINHSGVGTLFFSKNTKRYLFLLRHGARFSNTWGLVGGKIEKNETILEALNREIIEEIGMMPDIIKYIPIESFTSNDNQFQYHTYICQVNNEFLPILNHEHVGYCWTSLPNYPKPLHPGVWNIFNFDVIKEKIKTIETIF